VARLSIADVARMRRMWRDKQVKTIRHLANVFGVKEGYAGRIIRREIYKEVEPELEPTESSDVEVDGEEVSHVSGDEAGPGREARADG
jgi:uncharacterized protein (UPF0218 family)